jgi:hypothetical protein
METQQVDQPVVPESHSSEPDPISQEVADTTARIHFEGKGLDPELERSFEDV